MDRQTIRYPDGAVELKCSVNDAVMLLAEYEDTGREPEEIAELTKSLLVGMNKRNRAMELLQAESEGRLIVLPSDPYEMADVAQEILSRACRLQREAEAALGGDGDDQH